MRDLLLRSYYRFEGQGRVRGKQPQSWKHTNFDSMIGIGFSGAKASLEKFPGWEPESWAYHGDDGKSWCCHNNGKPYGPTFTTGDIIGCGVNFMTGCAFFTKNGNWQGTYTNFTCLGTI